MTEHRASTSVDKILDTIDVGLQRSAEFGFGDDVEGSCWRCGTTSGELLDVGLCHPCRAILRAPVEEIADQTTESFVTDRVLVDGEPMRAVRTATVTLRVNMQPFIDSLAAMALAWPSVPPQRDGRGVRGIAPAILHVDEATEAAEAILRQGVIGDRP